MPTATDPLRFEHEGRTFTCHVEGSPASARGAWWWFAVSTEPHQRHAPFRATDDDTLESVRARIVAYHDDRIARRNAPWQPYRRPAAASTAAAAVAAPAEAVPPVG